MFVDCNKYKSTSLIKIHLIGFLWTLTIISTNIVYLVKWIVEQLQALDNLTRRPSDYWE